MDTKLNVQELFFQMKNKKQSRVRSFDSALYDLGIHQELKTAMTQVVDCKEKSRIKKVA